MVGPSGCGKSVYLASLLRGGLARSARARPMKARPMSELADRLEAQAFDILRGRTPPGTNAVGSFELGVDLPGSRFFDLGAESVDLTMVDPPGGECIPPLGQACSPAVAAALEEAEGLLLLLPPVQVPHLIQRLGATLAGLDFLRVAVAMTMSELLVRDEADPYLALEGLDAQDAIEALHGPELRPELLHHVPRGADSWHLLSAFGFDRRSHRAVAEQVDGRWVIAAPDEDGFLGEWWPYRIFEPLEFLARGVAWHAWGAP